MRDFITSFILPIQARQSSSRPGIPTVATGKDAGIELQGIRVRALAEKNGNDQGYRNQQRRSKASPKVYIVSLFCRVCNVEINESAGTSPGRI